jgi:hypothetical protein
MQARPAGTRERARRLRVRLQACVVIRELGCACRDDPDTNCSSRELYRDGQRVDSGGKSRTRGIEAGDQPGKVIAQGQRRSGGNEPADLPASTEEQRFDGGLRDTECPTELVIREAADLAQHERASLAARKARDRGPDRLEIGGADRRCERVGQVRRKIGESERLAHACMDPRPALVARDRGELGVPRVVGSPARRRCALTGRPAELRLRPRRDRGATDDTARAPFGRDR